jgi:hypothetical protein
MISDKGKDIIKQFFAGQVAQIGNVLAFGTGTTAESAADTALAAEVYRIHLTSISADTAHDRLVFKASVPANIVFDTVHEVALFNEGDLVARTVLVDPVTLDPSVPTDFEYSLGVTVGIAG